MTGVPRAFVFDVNKCTGCGACQLACTIENGLEPDRSWRSVSTFNERLHPGIPLFHLSLACNHCAQPACAEACPALAYYRDPNTGAVLINEDACIGCSYCAWACPFDAPRLDPSRGVMTKCTFCNHRLAQGKTPACAALCPTGALTVAEVHRAELTQPVSGFPVTALRPAIRIIPPRGDFVPLAGTEAPTSLPGAALPAKISLRKEWPLAVFTLIVAVLFAQVAAALALPSAWRGTAPALAFAALAAAGMLLGAAHLGRKSRAWRIVLNVRRSPLSREIVAFSAFALAGIAYLAPLGAEAVAGPIAGATGFLALLAVEAVYQYAERPNGRRPHSANVLLTGPFLAALLVLGSDSGTEPVSRLATLLFLGFGALKLGLYVGRKRLLRSPGPGSGRELWATAARVGFPTVAFLVGAAAGSLAVVAAGALVGELIDRCELYTELSIMTPRLQMERDLGVRLGRAAG